MVISHVNTVFIKTIFKQVLWTILNSEDTCCENMLAYLKESYFWLTVATYLLLIYLMGNELSGWQIDNWTAADK